jgi:membrane protease YdiL (CAAX protease family)
VRSRNARGRSEYWSAGLIATFALGCGPSIPRARTSEAEPTTRREAESAERVARASCEPTLALAFPGIGQFCQNRPAEGAVLASLAVAEIGTVAGVAVERDRGLEGLEHPAAGVPLIALQNLWLYGYADAVFETQRAYQYRFVPHDTLAELAFASFNPRVLGEPDVWLGLLTLTSAGVGVSLLVDEQLDSDDFGDDPNLFGRTFDSNVGYPLAGAVGVGLFSHVAIGEEAVFRGMIQSQMAREMDETRAWIAASLVFGVAHAPNVLVVPSKLRARYLLLGVPFITLTGSYLGLSYRWHDYSLAPPVALHFWYDFLLSAVFFALDPQDSPLSARIAVPF